MGGFDPIPVDFASSTGISGKGILVGESKNQMHGFNCAGAYGLTPVASDAR